MRKKERKKKNVITNNIHPRQKKTIRILYTILEIYICLSALYRNAFFCVHVCVVFGCEWECCFVSFDYYFFQPDMVVKLIIIFQKSDIKSGTRIVATIVKKSKRFDLKNINKNGSAMCFRCMWRMWLYVADGKI